MPLTHAEELRLTNAAKQIYEKYIILDVVREKAFCNEKLDNTKKFRLFDIPNKLQNELLSFENLTVNLRP